MSASRLSGLTARMGSPLAFRAVRGGRSGPLAGPSVPGGPRHVHSYDRIGRDSARHQAGRRGGSGRLDRCRRVGCRQHGAHRGLGSSSSRVSPVPAVKGPGANVVAANIDMVFICDALDGVLGLRHLEPFLALAWQSGAFPWWSSQRPMRWAGKSWPRRGGGQDSGRRGQRSCDQFQDG